MLLAIWRICCLECVRALPAIRFLVASGSQSQAAWLSHLELGESITPVPATRSCSPAILQDVVVGSSVENRTDNRFRGTFKTRAQSRTDPQPSVKRATPGSGGLESP